MTTITDDGFDVSDHSNENGQNENGQNENGQNENGQNENGQKEKNAENEDTGKGKKDVNENGEEKATAKKPDGQEAEGRETETVPAKSAEAASVETVPAKTPTAQTAHAAQTGPLWSGRQMANVVRRALAVVVVLGIVGYGLGALRGASNTARAEFVYSLDESIPDGFLREDRRLLTQLVTFKSDAVLAPVAADFDLTVDALRSKIDVDTLELSEVIRLDVSDADADTAVAINGAVLEQYLQVITDAAPADDGQELAARRIEIADQLVAADASRLALVASQSEDVTLKLRQESVQRQVDLTNERINLLQQNLDSADLGQISSAQAEAVTVSLGAARAELLGLEAQLIAIGTQRAELSTATLSQPSLTREIDRLESQLATVDAELTQRELGPLVASPIRELNEPLVVLHSRHLSGLQGMAAGLLLAVPLAAMAAYRSRKLQLWFD